MSRRERVPHRRFPDKFSDSHRVDESASTAEQQRISAMDRETEARWQRVIIEENPAFSRLMGVRFTSGSRDRIEAELTVGEDLANRNGVMHGGAIMAFADILGGAASVLNLPDGARTTTIESKTNFFRAVPLGETARAVCIPLHRGRTTMVWQTTITRADGKEAAIVTQTQLVMPSFRRPSTASYGP
jgi:1,4-dihydroxy-2-naphthoyl-CoA hydrolase